MKRGSLRFTRTLQKQATKTGDYYTLSIPREVAQDLQLEAGGLCSIEVRERLRGSAEVALIAYQDDPLYVHQFNPASFVDDTIDPMTEISLTKPTTKGPSKQVESQGWKPTLRAVHWSLKVVEKRVDKMMSTPSGRAAMAEAFRRRGFM